MVRYIIPTIGDRMKGFIEVESLRTGKPYLVNVDAIESVMPLDDYTNIYMRLPISRYGGYTNQRELYQLFYEVRQSYEEIKAMIEEAMK